RSNGYFLETEDVTIDLIEWENQLADLPEVSQDTIHQYENVMQLNQAAYLQQYSFIWLEAERERLEKCWYDAMIKIAAYFVEIDDITKATSIYKDMCERQPDKEAAHFALMKL